MAFNSVRFLVFFALVFLLHQLTPRRWRWCVLLPAGYALYWTFNPAYCLLLLAVTAATYFSAKIVATTLTPVRRRTWLLVCLALVLGLLGLFKYYNFLATAINDLASGLTGHNRHPAPGLDLVLPVGISFYTFQTLAYLLDVHRGSLTPELHAGRYLAFAGFFPVLLSGPITRAGVLLPQLAAPAPWSRQEAGQGLRLILLGLFKKVMIADRLAVVAAKVFTTPDDHEGPVLLAGALCFSFQIYYDFSGYTDMAIGFARVLGYKLPENFNRPYSARSLTDFWRRWHISLSTWFRDYLYIPLGGNRVSPPRWYANLMVTFLVSGLWHGANWTFVIWGGLHGGLLALEAASSNLRRRFLEPWIGRWPRVQGALSMGLTFTLVTAAWVFFRANNLDDALYILSHVFLDWEDFAMEDIFRLGVGRYEWVATLAAVALYEALAWAEAHGKRWRLEGLALPLRWAVYYLMLACIVLLGVLEQADFVYMRF